MRKSGATGGKIESTKGSHVVFKPLASTKNVTRETVENRSQKSDVEINGLEGTRAQYAKQASPHTGFKEYATAFTTRSPTPTPQHLLAGVPTLGRGVGPAASRSTEVSRAATQFHREQLHPGGQESAVTHETVSPPSLSRSKLQLQPVGVQWAHVAWAFCSSLAAGLVALACTAMRASFFGRVSQGCDTGRIGATTHGRYGAVHGVASDVHAATAAGEATKLHS